MLYASDQAPALRTPIPPTFGSSSEAPFDASSFGAPDAKTARLKSAALALQNRDFYMREAGAQMLAGIDAPETLLLLSDACRDKESRVVEAGLRSLLGCYAIGLAGAEETLLRVMTANGKETVAAKLLMQLAPAAVGQTLKVGDIAVRRAQFLAANPELARSRLAALESGSAQNIQALRSMRLRGNPSFGALFDVVLNDPDLPGSLRAMLLRRGEFIYESESGGRQIQSARSSADVVNTSADPLTLEPFWLETRRMTGLLAAIGTDPALSDLANLMIDRTMRRQSDALWNLIRREIVYVPEVVVGSGPHSTNFCCTLAALRPDRLPLVIERRDRIGGQFAVPDQPAWLLNSRARPAAPDRRSVPGTADALNSLGAYAPIQEADLTGQSFGGQDRLAMASRLSLFLSCSALIETSVVEWTTNSKESRNRFGFGDYSGTSASTDRSESAVTAAGRYLVKVENVRTGESGFLQTDAIISSAGLGAAKNAFPVRNSTAMSGGAGADSRAVSGTTLDPAKPGAEPQPPSPQRALAGAVSEGTPAALPVIAPTPGLVRRYSFDSFMQRLTASADAFPLRGLDKVIVIGAGDSGRVTVEALLGYGPRAGRTVHTLDRVGEVVWIGQPVKTREEFLACQRPRYFWLGLEFPRGGEVLPSRPGAEAERSTARQQRRKLDNPASSLNANRVASRIRPVAERAVSFSEDALGCVVITSSGEAFRADIVIDCSGFGDAAEESRTPPRPLASLARALRQGSRFRVCDVLDARIDLLIKCVSAERLEKASTTRRFTGTVQRFDGWLAIGAPISFTTEYCLPAKTGETLERAIRIACREPNVGALYLKRTVLPPVFSTLNGQRQPIARREANENVFYIGPQAGLPAEVFVNGDGAIPVDAGTPVRGIDPADPQDPAGTASSPRKEDAVSIWRYAETVTAFGEYYFMNVGAAARNAQAALWSDFPKFTPRDLRPGSDEGPPSAGSSSPGRVAVTSQSLNAKARMATSIHVLAPDLAEPPGPGLSPVAAGAAGSERLLRYVLAEHLRGFRLAIPSVKVPGRAAARPRPPLTLRMFLTLEVAQKELGGSEASLRVEWADDVFKGISLRPVAEAIGREPLVQSLICQWSFSGSGDMRYRPWTPAVGDGPERPARPARSVLVEIEVRAGRLVLQDVRWDSSRR